MNVLRTIFPCFRPCWDCIEGPSFGNDVYAKYTPYYQPTVRLDVTRMGKDVVILKEGERICGTGGCLATVPIVQNKAFFQVTIQQNGIWGFGLGHKQTPLENVPLKEKFWGIRDNGDVVAEDNVIGKITKPIEDGDTIGVTYDHVELKFYINDVDCGLCITGIRGPIYPIIYVDESAILDIKFKNFTASVPPGFGEILVEQTLL